MFVVRFGVFFVEILKWRFEKEPICCCEPALYFLAHCYCDIRNGVFTPLSFQDERYFTLFLVSGLHFVKDNNIFSPLE